jgi:hypothetical protein
MTLYPALGSARILIVSMRNLSPHVSRCAAYEFEDMIRACDAADLLAPVRYVHRGRIMRRVWRAGRAGRLLAPPITAGRDYDLLLALCQNPFDLRCLAQLRGIRDRCRRSACFLGEVWSAAIDKWRADLKHIADFDAVFTPFASSVAALSEVLGRPCHLILGGVDAAGFCPYPDRPLRSIDVYSMGRRPEIVHGALMRLAERGRLFYVYDTVSNFAVRDPAEHRALLSNFVKRSRYFLAYRAKFDSPDETHGQEELGLRHFEGAAGGAVMLGSAPRCEAYDQNFDWPDAVVPLSATNAFEVGEVIAELDGQPERVARIRRDNVVNSLLRHDWVYRWSQMLDIVGLPPSDGMPLRKAHLKRLAGKVLHAGEACASHVTLHGAVRRRRRR